MNAHSGADESLPGTVQAHYKAVVAQLANLVGSSPLSCRSSAGVIEAHPRVVESHPGAKEAQTRVLKVHLSLLRLSL
jgi:hypothetical protein